MRTQRLLSVIVTCLTTMLVTRPVDADVLSYEGFASGDYIEGPVLGQPITGTGYTDGATWSSDSDFFADGLTYSTLLTTDGVHVSRDAGDMEGVLDLTAGGPFGAAGLVGTNGKIGGTGVTSTIYYSVLARRDDTQGASFAGFQTFNGPVNGPGTVEGFGPGEVGDPLNYTWFQGGSNDPIGIGTPFDTETHLFVVRIDYDEFVASEATIWIDPDLELAETEQSLDISSDVTLNEGGDEGFDRIVMRGTRLWSFDEIRFGTTWEDVTPTENQGPLSDLNSNGFVDFEDLTILLANWNKDVGVEDGNLVEPLVTVVNFADLTVLLADWTGPGPAGSPEAALGAEAVPEPSTLLLGVMAMLGLSFYRRRRAAGTGVALAHQGLHLPKHRQR